MSTDWLWEGNSPPKLITFYYNCWTFISSKFIFSFASASNFCSSKTEYSLLILGIFWIFIALAPNLRDVNVSYSLNELAEQQRIIQVFAFPPRDS